MKLRDLVLVILGAWFYAWFAFKIGGWIGLVLLILGLLFMGVAAEFWGYDSRDQHDGTSRSQRIR